MSSLPPNEDKVEPSILSPKLFPSLVSRGRSDRTADTTLVGDDATINHFDDEDDLNKLEENLSKTKAIQDSLDLSLDEKQAKDIDEVETSRHEDGHHGIDILAASLARTNEGKGKLSYLIQKRVRLSYQDDLETKFETKKGDVVRKRKTPLAYLKEEHAALGIIFKYCLQTSRLARITILFCVIMGQMFVCGTFYDETSDANSHSVATFWDVLVRFTLTDFVVAVLGTVLMIPVGMILTIFFSIKKISPDLPVEEQKTLFKKNKKKLILAFGLAAVWWLWCTYAITIYSLSFSEYHSYKWIITFFVGTFYDLLIADPLKIIIKAVIILLLRERCGDCGDLLAAKLALDLPSIFSPPS